MLKRDIASKIRDGSTDIYSVIYDGNLDIEDLTRLIIELDCALVVTCDALANALDQTAEQVRGDVYGSLSDNLTDAWSDGYGHWNDESIGDYTDKCPKCLLHMQCPGYYNGCFEAVNRQQMEVL